MFSTKITILEHNNFFVNNSSNQKPNLHLFGFQPYDYVELVSDEEVSRVLGPNYITRCSQLTFEADIRNAIERILERRTNNVIDRKHVKTKIFIKTKLSARTQYMLLLMNIFI